MNIETGNKEVNEVGNPAVENFRKIKPEKEMTSNEVADFWKSEFHDCAEQAQSEDFKFIEKNLHDFLSFETNIKSTELADLVLLDKKFAIFSFFHDIHSPVIVCKGRPSIDLIITEAPKKCNGSRKFFRS